MQCTQCSLVSTMLFTKKIECLIHLNNTIHSAIHRSHPSVPGFTAVSHSLFFSVFPASSICSAIIHEPGLRLCVCTSPSPSLFFLIVTVKCAAALTIYLHQSFFTFHFHLHDFPPRLTILFSVAVIRKVFSLDTAMTSCLHYNKYSYYSPSILPHFMPSLFLPSYLHSVLFSIKCREADRIPAIFCGTFRVPLNSKGKLWSVSK